MKMTFAPGLPGTFAVRIDGNDAGTIPLGLNQLDTCNALADIVDAYVPPLAVATEPELPPVLDPVLDSSLAAGVPDPKPTREAP